MATPVVKLGNPFGNVAAAFVGKLGNPFGHGALAPVGKIGYPMGNGAAPPVGKIGHPFGKAVAPPMWKLSLPFTMLLLMNSISIGALKLNLMYLFIPSCISYIPQRVHHIDHCGIYKFYRYDKPK